MTTDDTRPELARNLDDMAQDAVGAVRAFLQKPDTTSLDIGRARIATAALSSWSRHKQTESARESNFILLARELAEDRTQFRRLVSVAMPDAAIVKALPAAAAQ